MCRKNIAKVPTVTSVTHFREKENTILRMATSSLFVIGHVIEGEKEIFTGENTVNISQGETYLLSIGNHYSKNLISPNSRFEELMITITHTAPVNYPQTKDLWALDVEKSSCIGHDNISHLSWVFTYPHVAMLRAALTSASATLPQCAQRKCLPCLMPM